MQWKPNALLVLASFSGMLLSLEGCGALWQEARFKETRHLEVDHVPASAIDVETRNGAVTIRSGDVESVWIDATIKAISQERLDATEIVASRADDGVLLLRVVWPDERRYGSEGVNFDISLPDVLGVRVRTGNGKVELAGTAGEADLRTSNGAITIDRHDGSVRARSSNGALRFEHVAGDVDAETSNGRVEFDELHGGVRAQTSNGRMSVHLADDARGPLDLRTSNGSIELHLPGTFAGEIDADTSNGSVRLQDVPAAAVASTRRGSATLRFGEGEGSRVRTSNGSITIRAGGERAAAPAPVEAGAGDGTG